MIQNRYLILLLLITLYVGSNSCNEAKYMQGKRTYDIMCGDCHMEDGSGVKNLYPHLKPLNASVLINEIPCIIKHGLNREASLIKMPPNPSLLPVDITNIVNYLLNDLNNYKQEYTMVEIEKQLLLCHPDTIQK